MEKKRRKAGAPKGVPLAREYRTAEDHVTCYSDHVNVVSTATGETIVSFYETIPGYPSSEPGVTSTRRATIILSHRHAGEIGQLLIKHAANAEQLKESKAASR